MKKITTRDLVQTALFIALALVVRQISIMIPFGGSSGMRIGISEVFTKMPALLFGPVLGGISSGLVDILAQVIKSEGAYLWLMLPVMILGGVITGVCWKFFKNISPKKLRRGFFIGCSVFGLFGIINSAIVVFNIEGAYLTALSSLNNKIVFTTYGLIAIAVFGFLFMAVDFIVRKRAGDNYKDDFMQLALTVFTSDVIVTTLNTIILRLPVPFGVGLSKLPFLVFYIPRLIPDFVATFLFAYLLSCMLKIYNRVIKK